MQSALCIKKKNKPAGVAAFTRVTLQSNAFSAFLDHLGMWVIVWSLLELVLRTC